MGFDRRTSDPMRYLCTIVFWLVALPFGVYADSDPAQGYTIVATTGMVADLARNIAAERASVQQLIGSGVDPHLYKPTRTDIAALMAADVVIYNGLLLEGKMSDALIRVASTGKPVVAVTEQLEPEDLLEPESFAGHYDPHVWMDPQSWIAAATVVQQRLVVFDPAHAETYERNARSYIVQLDRLHTYAEQVLASVPPSQRVLVTAHDAFNYFGRRFHFEVVGIQGLSTESEAGVKDIERIVQLLVQKRIPAVFVESTVSERNIRALIEGASAQNHTVHIGGELFSDAMGAEATYEGSYIGMIDHNVTTIAKALGGSVPPRGMQGLLRREGR